MSHVSVAPDRARPAGQPVTPFLELRDLRAGYGGASVLRGVDLTVGPGEVVVVLGANGAGKTTLMRAISGLIPHSGDVLVDGRTVRKARPEQMLGMGIGLVPQGRGTLSDLTVQDNLRVGAITRRAGAEVEADIDHWCRVFAPLGDRRNQIAGLLSGGEQQMLAIARAMMARPRLLLCDEVSLGLAPIVVQQLFAVLSDVNRESDTGLLLVEQNAALALDIASRVYLFEVGEVAAAGPVEDFRGNDHNPTRIPGVLMPYIRSCTAGLR